MTLSFIIVTHNSAHDIGPLLTSFFEFEPTLDYELIIVDNYSNDDSVNIIRSFTSDKIKLYDRKVRNGFGNNCNYGLAKSTGDIVAFINPDIVFLENSFDKLVEYFKTSSYGIIGPRLLNSDYTIQYSARKFITLKLFLVRIMNKGQDHVDTQAMRTYFYDGLVTDKVIDVDWVTGAAMFVKREVINDIKGGFDEVYTMYIEDQDICFMAKMHGWKTGYYPYTRILHHHQRNSIMKFSKKTRYHLTGFFIFFFKKLFSIKNRLVK
ncbi:glycosyltransferase family 2 protein [Mucilaginibacter sp. SP1R1]|uniref:glycosyltransferase family 2 protein n=1 Tax=Mucilaginibacter sp. SP1R1 TaxID=2723091 RepID=UPI00162264B7|nr:glycosyltransferase [Mucilaginibacter sp. SP1R1]MBB6152613.1 hypothetical protein [Mucilaginibacter sp. SP1R1]